MRHILIATTILGASAGSVAAGGLDRSYTPIDMLFHDGNYVEFRLSYTNPSADGRDVAGFKTRDVGKTYFNLGGGIKMDVSEKMSFAMIYDQPYGIDVKYGGSSVVLGGTRAKSDSDALTVLMRYKFNENFSLYGGPRLVRADGNVTLGGLAYGPVNGYNVDFKSDSAVGGVAGVAYERPDIALRVALTYHSQTKLSMRSKETFPVGFPNPMIPGGVPLELGNTKTKMPQSLKLLFQTGVAKDTLLFGSVRWSDWSKFELVPPALSANLAEIKDKWNFELGVGHKFTERFGASLMFDYEIKDSSSLVSPLAPYNGKYGVTLGGRYNLTEQMTVSGGVRYTWLGDAKPQTAGTARAKFKSNNSISYGMKIGYEF